MAGIEFDGFVKGFDGLANFSPGMGDIGQLEITFCQRFLVVTMAFEHVIEKEQGPVGGALFQVFFCHFE